MSVSYMENATTIVCTKNVDFEFSAHNAFLVEKNQFAASLNEQLR